MAEDYLRTVQSDWVRMAQPRVETDHLLMTTKYQPVELSPTPSYTLPYSWQITDSHGF
jgi:hypothetical protein